MLHFATSAVAGSPGYYRRQDAAATFSFSTTNLAPQSSKKIAYSIRMTIFIRIDCYHRSNAFSDRSKRKIGRSVVQRYDLVKTDGLN